MQQQHQQGNAGRRHNPMSMSGAGAGAGGATGSTGKGSQLGREETIRYINERENPEHPVHNEEPDDLSDF